MIENLFLSVGAMKAGTTWLYDQFRSHPQVYFSPEKEIHYFANRVGIEDQLNHRARIEKLKACMVRLGASNPKHIAGKVEEICWYAEYARPGQVDDDWYESLFRFSEARYCADFSNLYCLMSAQAWSHVRSVAKNVRAVYTVRDPIERLWSHYKFHMKWSGRENDVLLAGFDTFEDILGKDWFWRNTSYAGNYSELVKGLGSDNVKLLFFEDVHNDPQRVIRELEAMLEVEHVEIDSTKLAHRVNATERVDMPEEWRKFAMSKLRPQIDEMKNQGIWHHAWCDMS